MMKVDITRSANQKTATARGGRPMVPGPRPACCERPMVRASERITAAGVLIRGYRCNACGRRESVVEDE